MDRLLDTVAPEGLGAYVRTAREQRARSPDDLGQPGFSATYITALEAGRFSPSVVALQLLAKRLDVPVPDLLALRVPMPPDPDLAALAEDLEYQLDQALALLLKHQLQDALQLVHGAAHEYRAYLPDLAGPTLFRFYMVQGRLSLRAQNLAQSEAAVIKALEIARRLGDERMMVRARNGLGGIYYAQGLPAQALEQHSLCLSAIHAGLFKDLDTRVIILSNLANDYWALNDPRQAIGIYKEMEKLLPDILDYERHGAVYWGLSLAYAALGKLAWAKLYAMKSLNVLEGDSSWVSAAQVRLNLAEIMVARAEYADAEQMLDQARAFEETAGDPLRLINIYDVYARLELARGQCEAAAAYAAQAVARCVQVLEQDAGGQAVSKPYLMRSYATALCVAAQVAEAQKSRAQADRLFTQALEQVHRTEYNEAITAIELSYAEALAGREAHTEAARHYRAAYALRLPRTAH